MIKVSAGWRIADCATFSAVANSKEMDLIGGITRSLPIPVFQGSRLSFLEPISSDNALDKAKI